MMNDEWSLRSVALRGLAAAPFIVSVACGRSSNHAHSTGSTGSAAAAARPSGTAAAGPVDASPASTTDGSLLEGVPLELGNGVTLTFTTKQTRPETKFDPATYKHEVTASCPRRTITVLESELIGGREAEVSVRAAGDAVVIVLDTYLEQSGLGAAGHISNSVTLDLATCAVTRR